ncbi:ABC transporter substrate-binding protein/permease [Weissella cibaria]|uniref:Glutamine transport system permease protein GlnP n=1 Tax=Weissella cibaria TaxID=137591 RepID=A0A2S1KUG8_9LACO|nr:ABC transporter substrate-binding protein/permease [Weissella cibaria]AWF96604.1 Putative glutamine transport system permease protein GlnP [Weissella cibaria]
MQKWVTKIMAAVMTMMMLIGMVAPASAAQTDPVLSKIEKSGKLVVGTSADYAPYEFHTTVNGKDKIVGFDISVANEIAKRLGVKLVIQEMSFDALLGAVKTGKVDMVVAGMTATPEREQEASFSEPYFVDKNVVMTLKKNANKLTNLNDLKKATLAAQLSSIQEDAAKQVDAKKVVSLKKVNDAVTQLTQGKVDGVVVPDTTADSYLGESTQFAVAKATLPGETNGSSVVMAKNATVLQSKVNNILEKHVIGAPLDKWRDEATALMNHKESFFEKYYPYFVKGTINTVGLAVIGVFFGIVLGILLALMKLSSVKPLKWFAVAYIEAVRGVPLLIQVFIVYFGTQVIGLNVSSFMAGAIAMFLNSAAYVAEIIRSGIQAVPDGQTEAARSLGFTKMQTMRYMVLPQAIKNILPALGNEFVTVIKEGSVVSVIGVGELTFQTSVVQGASFKPFIPLIISAAIYFILTFGISRLLGRFEKKMQQSDRKLI